MTITPHVLVSRILYGEFFVFTLPIYKVCNSTLHSEFSIQEEQLFHLHSRNPLLFEANIVAAAVYFLKFTNIKWSFSRAFHFGQSHVLIENDRDNTCT
jgi:hypothetical protein